MPKDTLEKRMYLSAFACNINVNNYIMLCYDQCHGCHLATACHHSGDMVTAVSVELYGHSLNEAVRLFH